jgi:sulfur carrier protein ThiS adenylyltransferase
LKIFINEREARVVHGSTAGGLRDLIKPGADIIVVNGFPALAETLLREGDRVVLIRRGEIPPSHELEALLAARHTPGIYEKLKKARVGIAGLGGLGSHVATALVRVGVGHLVLADFDVVEPSNLGRQAYFADQIGMEKTEALGANLQRVNPYAGLTLHTTRIDGCNAPLLFSGCSVVVEALDRAEEKAMLIEALLEGLPSAEIIAASGLAGHGTSETIRVHRLGKRLYVVGDLESEARPFMGLMAPRVGVAAHIQANLAVRLLLGEEY